MEYPFFHRVSAHLRLTKPSDGPVRDDLHGGHTLASPLGGVYDKLHDGVNSPGNRGDCRSRDHAHAIR